MIKLTTEQLKNICFAHHDFADMRKCKCENCPLRNNEQCNWVLKENLVLYAIDMLEKQLAETQLKELLSALYQRTEKPFTLERKDIVELAEDYGIKEEELK